MPKIDLGDTGGSSSPPSALAPGPFDVYLEQLDRALESERGIAFTTGSPAAARAYRWKLYNARRYARNRGNHFYDELIVSLQGSEVMIVRANPNTGKERPL